MADRVNKYDTMYQVYANGQIRHAGINFLQTGDIRGPRAASQTRLQSPKPRLKAGDPVGSLLMIYRNSLSEVLRKWKKARASMEKQLKQASAG